MDVLSTMAAIELTDVGFKMLAVALVMASAAWALGLVGVNYMKALGRNPEAGKAAGSIVVLAAFVEATALFALIAGLIIS